MSRNIFNKINTSGAPAATAINEAGGKAYGMSAEQAFAQLMMTGVFNNTFHVTGKAQLSEFLDLAKKLDPKFRHQAAIFAAENGGSRLAQYTAVAVSLATGDREGFDRAFTTVVKNVGAVREVVGIFRSGVLGRKSFGTRPKRLLKGVLENMSGEQIFRSSIGNDPSLGDIVKLLHPKPTTAEANAVFAREIEKPFDLNLLPAIVKQYDNFRTTKEGAVPQVDIRLLGNLELSDEQWAKLIPGFSWTTIRMNIRKWNEKGLFTKYPTLVAKVAAKLRDKELLSKVDPEPYQLMMTFMAIRNSGMPREIITSIEDALEYSLNSVDELGCKVVLCPDLSASTKSPLTGDRAGGTSDVRTVDVAALFTAALLRRNPDSLVLPFDDRVWDNLSLNPKDTVTTIANVLANAGGGGTKCQLPLEYLLDHKIKADLIIMFSDNESWMDSDGRGHGPCSSGSWYGGKPTDLMDTFLKYKKVNQNAKLVCVDLQPVTSMQTINRPDILNIGGFSDSVFKLIRQFVKGGFDGDLLVKQIKSIPLE